MHVRELYYPHSRPHAQDRDGSTACSKYSPAYYSAVRGGTTRCYLCPPGYMCEDSKLCLAGTYRSSLGYTSCSSCNGRCANTTRLYECTSCVQAKAINCTEGQNVPVYSLRQKLIHLTDERIIQNYSEK